MARTNYYEILGVDQTASQGEIKRAFRGLALKYHPDINKAPDAEDRFKEIGEAYSVLLDPEKRHLYDVGGSAEIHRRYTTEDLLRGVFNEIIKDKLSPMEHSIARMVVHLLFIWARSK